MIVEIDRDDIVRLLTSATQFVSFDYLTTHSELVSIDGWGKIWWKVKAFEQYTDDDLWKLYCELTGNRMNVLKKS